VNKKRSHKSWRTYRAVAVWVSSQRQAKFVVKNKSCPGLTAFDVQIFGLNFLTGSYERGWSPSTKRCTQLLRVIGGESTASPPLGKTTND
jgi:hypothetical protein